MRVNNEFKPGLASHLHVLSGKRLRLTLRAHLHLVHVQVALQEHLISSLHPLEY